MEGEKEKDGHLRDNRAYLCAPLGGARGCEEEEKSPAKAFASVCLHLTETNINLSKIYSCFRLSIGNEASTDYWRPLWRRFFVPGGFAHDEMCATATLLNYHGCYL